VNHGKTLFIIESKFGNDGYAAWFKILEMLGKSENHYIDCRNETDWEFMAAKIKLMSTSLNDIIDLLAKLNAINPILWNNKIIWSENFIKNIEDAYKRRNNKCMYFDEIVALTGINVNINSNNADINTQRKVKDTKVKDTKVKDIIQNKEVLDLNEFSKVYFDEKFIGEKSLDIFDKLMRIDGYTKDQIMQAIKFGRGDPFWSSNFLSPQKLRNKNKDGVKYIDVFLAKILSNGNNQTGNKPKYAATDEQLAASIAKHFATDNDI
jgi:hypothetical protein